MLAEQTVQMIYEWMSTYLVHPHPQMKRSGAVCPFVKPALNVDGVRVQAVSTLAPDPDRSVFEAAKRALEQFPPVELRVQKNAQQALVLAFPDLVDRGEVIDRVHAKVKHDAVRNGLMIGQLHPTCVEPSARNTAFAVNWAPVPLLAIRHMAVHDILFLNQRRSWFHEYDKRFLHLYEDRRQKDPVLRELYEKARARFGSGYAELAHAAGGKWSA